jgi:carbonic anhydrase
MATALLRSLRSPLRSTARALSLAAAAPAAAAAMAGGFDGSRSRLPEMLRHNADFVARGSGAAFAVAPDTPLPRCVILTCMDSRLTHLLPAALNIKQGEAKIVKTAGAILAHPFGGIMRSILVALYELRCSEVFVVGHDDCGMGGIDPASTKRKMVDAGVPADRMRMLKTAGIDVDRWLKGFDSVDDSVQHAVEVIRTHPLVPPGLRVTGLVISPTSGLLRHAGAPHKHE